MSEKPEKHYSIREIAAEWHFSVGVIRNIFSKEPGVLRLGHGETKNKNKYVNVRIPESVKDRVYKELTSKDPR